ncbi:hypothetical protein VPH35_062030 [Triticum aestivum]
MTAKRSYIFRIQFQPRRPERLRYRRRPSGARDHRTGERFATRVKKPPPERTIEKAAPPSSPFKLAATVPAASSHARVVDQQHHRRLLPAVAPRRRHRRWRTTLNTVTCGRC